MGFRNPINGVPPSAITAAMLADGSVTGPKIHAGAVTADKIDAGAVTADKIEATAIDGKTITGATIRTAATGARTVMSTTKDLAFYTGDGAETAPGELDVYAGLGASGGVVTTVMLKGPAVTSAAAGSYQNALFLTEDGGVVDNGTGKGRLITLRTARVNVEGPQGTPSLDVSGGTPVLDLAGGEVRNASWSGGVATFDQATGKTRFSNVTSAAGRHPVLEGTSPTLEFLDTDQGGPVAGPFWLHSNTGQFFILQDRTGDGTWDTPHPLVVNTAGQVTLGIRGTAASHAARLDDLPEIATGGGSVTFDGTAVTAAATITYPSGRFTATPRVAANAVASANYFATISGQTATGCTITLTQYRFIAPAAGTVVSLNWIASNNP